MGIGAKFTVIKKKHSGKLLKGVMVDHVYNV